MGRLNSRLFVDSSRGLWSTPHRLTMNGEGKVAKMAKVWNASWTLKELGWM